MHSCQVRSSLCRTRAARAHGHTRTHAHKSGASFPLRRRIPPAAMMLPSMGARGPAHMLRCARCTAFGVCVVALAVVADAVDVTGVGGRMRPPSNGRTAAMPVDPPNSYKGYAEAGPWPMPRSLTRTGNITARFAQHNEFKFLCSSAPGCDPNACE